MKGGRPSSTARLIAKSTVLTASDPRFGIFISADAVRACEWFLQDHQVMGKLRLGLMRRTWYQDFQRVIESQMIPGIQLHYALRKLELERFAKESLERGVRQVIVLGAGYDTLCLRLARQCSNISFFEIDHPDTQLPKVISLKERREKPDNLNFISNDFLEKDLSVILQDNESIDSSAPTLVIAEGLLMYLSETVVRNLFEASRNTFQKNVS